MEKRQMSVEEAAKNGMFPNHEQMANGEKRYRLTNKDDGSSYVRTVAGPTGAWQDSHFHKRTTVFIVVQKGWMAFAELKHGDMTIHIVKDGETFVSKPGVPTNVYMSADAVTHSVKFCTTNAEKVNGQDDWHASPELDKITKSLAEVQIMFRAGMC